MMVINRTRNILHWSLGFPETVSPDAGIFRSARAGSNENVKRLLSLNKTSAEDTKMFGTSLLHSAFKSGNMALVCLLIQGGADVNAQDEDVESPLQGAMARSDNYDVASTFIQNGAIMSSKAVDGKATFHNSLNNTISHVLMRDDWFESMLPDSEAISITHFLAWSSKGTPKIFQRGHSYDDADILSADRFGGSFLHFAAYRGNLGVLSHLIKPVSMEDVERKDNQGRHPFHCAAESTSAAGLTDTLVGEGCNVYAVDDTGRTALQWAARWHNTKAIKKLIAIIDGETLLLSDTIERMSSWKVCQRRAPFLATCLRGLESSSGLGTEESNIIRLRRSYASHGAGLGFSLFLEIAEILALIFITFLGTPD